MVSGLSRFSAAVSAPSGPEGPAVALLLLRFGSLSAFEAAEDNFWGFLSG